MNRNKRRKRRLIEIHMIKNYPWSSMNRDDLGTPKTGIFGGVLRDRLSSQCLKRAWCTSDTYRETIGEDDCGIRTRFFPKLVRDQLVEEYGVSEEAADTIMPKIGGMYNKDNKENDKDPAKTSQIAFYSVDDIQAVTMAIKELLDSGTDAEKITAAMIKKNVKDMKTRRRAIDVCVRGSMATCDAIPNVEACLSVAHGMSTHEVRIEEDNYVAMDDLIQRYGDGESGAGFYGEYTEFSSQCMYIYVSIDLDVLEKEGKIGRTEEELAEATSKFVEAMLYSMAYHNPSGKKHAMANFVLPVCTLVECKDVKVPQMFSEAFATPIQPRDLVTNSIAELLKEHTYAIQDSGIQPKSFVYCARRYEEAVKENFSEDMTVCGSYADLVTKILEQLSVEK